MKKLIIGATIVILMLCGLLTLEALRYNRLDSKYELAVQNNKAYES
jgi:hypothetical protein